MKLPLVVVATVFAAVLALPAAAQDLQLKPLPPPPAMNSPGPKPATQAQLDAAKRDALTLPAMHDDGAGAPVDASGHTPPQVTVRSQGDDTVEEYRQGGKIYMVRITPKNGVPRTIMADDDGKLQRDPKLGPVAPVYYKVYEWGAAPKTAEEQAEQ
jgi:hypothetical protein